MAEAAERHVVEHLAEQVSPPELVALPAKSWPVCDTCRAKRSASNGPGCRPPSRLTEAYLWQHIDAPEYHRQRHELEAKLAELPPPADSNIIAFDQASERLLPISTICARRRPNIRAR